MEQSHVYIKKETMVKLKYDATIKARLNIVKKNIGENIILNLIKYEDAIVCFAQILGLCIYVVVGVLVYIMCC